MPTMEGREGKILIPAAHWPLTSLTALTADFH